VKTGVRAASTGDSLAGSSFSYPKVVKIAVAAVILLPLLFYTVSLLRIMGATLAFPWELDQGEGHNVWSAWLLMRGQGPYLDLNHYPFFDINYPPFHFVMMIPLLWVFGPSLLAGRLLADLCVFGLAAVVGAIVWRYSGRNRFATALGVLLILANPYLYIFGVIATVNVSQVMLGAWGLFCLGLALDRVEDDGRVVKADEIRWKPLIVGLVLLLAAIYTKQQAIDAVGTGFLFLLWRRPRLAIIAGLAFGAVGGGLFLLIDVVTANQFYINLIKVNINDFIKRQLLDQWTAYGLTHAPLLLLAAGYAWQTVRKKARLSLWLIYLVITTLGSALVGKFGAAETYFYSSIAAVAIGAALFSGEFFRNNFNIADFSFLNFKKSAPVPADSSDQPAPGPARRVTFSGAFAIGTVALLVLQNLIFYHTPETPHPWKDLIKGHSGNYVLFGTFPTEAEKAAGQRIADLVKASQPPIITEEASFAMVNGYEVVTNPSNILVYNQAGLWQSRELTQMVQNGCFSLIVLHGHFLPDVVQAQIPGKYRQVLTEHLPGGEYDVWQLLPGGRTTNPDGCFGH
jgi:hypothetical protein